MGDRKHNIMKILLIDDHALFRDGIRLLLGELSPEPEVLEAGDCGSGCALLEQHPDVSLILLDLELPDLNGTEALQRIRGRYPDIRLVVVSAHENVSNVLAALDAGALGFIPKAATPEIMLAALNLVLAGGIYLPPVMLSADTRNDASAEQSGAALPEGPALEGLSDRQVTVLRKLLQGRSNKDICRELDLSPSTVKNHVSAVFRVLNVSTRTQAVVAAARLGFTLE